MTRRYYDLYGKDPGYYKMKRHLAKLKKRDKGRWYGLNSQAGQDVIYRLDQAYQRFFSIAGAGRPGFKKRTRYTSFTLTQTGWKLLGGNRVRSGKRNYKFVKSHPIEGEIKTVTIKRDSCGDLWICFSVIQKAPTPDLPRTGNAVGLDFGLKCFLTTPDGDEVKASEHFKAGLREVQRLHKELSRKQATASGGKGSNHRKKAKRRLARCYRRIQNQRRDWHFKLARRLLSEYDFIAIEDLNLDGMKRLWGGKVSDLGYYSFVQILEHVANKEGKTVDQVDRYFASTQLCSGCRSKNSKLTLADREWVCADCGCVHDRDVNAATNVLERAFSSGEVGIRPSGAAAYDATSELFASPVA